MNCEGYRVHEVWAIAVPTSLMRNSWPEQGEWIEYVKSVYISILKELSFMATINNVYTKAERRRIMRNDNWVLWGDVGLYRNLLLHQRSELRVFDLALLLVWEAPFPGLHGNSFFVACTRLMMYALYPYVNSGKEDSKRYWGIPFNDQNGCFWWR